MAGHQELIKKLAEDDALRQQILDTRSLEGKHELVRNAGLEVPDHHDVLQAVAGGTSTVGSQAMVIDIGTGSVPISAAVAATVAAAF